MAPDQRVNGVYKIHSKQPDDHGQGCDVPSTPVPWRRNEDEDCGENRGDGEFVMHPALLRSRREVNESRASVSMTYGVCQATDNDGEDNGCLHDEQAGKFRAQ